MKLFHIGASIVSDQYSEFIIVEGLAGGTDRKHDAIAAAHAADQQQAVVIPEADHAA